MIEVVYGDIALTDVQKDVVNKVSQLEAEGTLYIGYPILTSVEGNVEVDALLVSPFGGIVALDLTLFDINFTDEPPEELIDRQNQLFAALTSKLTEEKRLVARRKLVVQPSVVSITADIEYSDEEIVVSTAESLPNYIANLPIIAPELIDILNSVVERTATLRPKKSRQKVMKANSRGKMLQEIEAKIANLDASQKRAAIEFPNSPQRIRGLAGSGKTIVLAMKASYLHLKNPEWRIVLTFYTRALYQQLTRLVRRFSFEFIKDEPNWDKLTIMHAWGSAYSWGIYAEMAEAVGAPIRDFRYAKQRYSYGSEFKGVVDELYAFIRDGNIDIRPIYDVVLVDEAQDLPQSFFELIYLFTKPPHRVVYAYDELQTLNDTEMPSPEELFGRRSNSKPRVTLVNKEGQPKQDITLPVCYRNTPWSLTTAHGIGFGIARERGLVQMFQKPETWTHIGYQVEEGDLSLGSKVSLRRADDATPSYFSQYLNEADATIFRDFEDEDAQYDWVADEIKKNITDDELELDDILVIFCDAVTIRSRSSKMMGALAKRKVRSHLVGVTESADEIFSASSVALTHIYRAKGNEAPMVYVVDANHCLSGFNIGTLRNVLFTAITRSRAWVRVCGVGAPMAALTKEFQSIRGDEYRLTFDYPTLSQLKKIKTRYRELASAQTAAIEADLNSLSRLADRFKAGTLEVEDLDPVVLPTLRSIVGEGE